MLIDVKNLKFGLTFIIGFAAGLEEFEHAQVRSPNGYGCLYVYSFFLYDVRNLELIRPCIKVDKIR